MKHGVAMHICYLQVGDVVRLIHSQGVKDLTRPRWLEYTLADGTKRKVDTYSIFSDDIQADTDFRSAYDCMTVTQVTDDYVNFIRPYIHVRKDGTLGAVGFEHVDNVSRTHGSLWYELLSR